MNETFSAANISSKSTRIFFLIQNIVCIVYIKSICARANNISVFGAKR